MMLGVAQSKPVARNLQEIEIRLRPLIGYGFMFETGKPFVELAYNV